MRKSKIIKVANVIMEGRYGGPQARITSIAEKLKENSIETIVIFPKNNSAFFYRKLAGKGIWTKRLSLHHFTKQKSHLAKFVILFIPELFSLYNLFKKKRIDIVHCNCSWQFKGAIAGKLARAKVLWHLNDTQTPFLINIIFKVLALYFCDAFIVAGERVKDYYLNNQRFSKKRIMEIQAPINTSLLDAQKVKKDRKMARYSGLKIVTVCNINPLKGIEYFIEMASILNKRHADLNFFVVGPHFDSQKKYSEKLFDLAEKLKTKNLNFYGPADDVPSILKATDIYVCSSIAEGSPISLWEAMSMAKPIVSTDVGDVARFIKSGKNGFVVPIKYSAALAEKVGLLIEDEELREKFGRKVRELAVKYFDIEVCARKHSEFYREILSIHN